MQDIESGIRSDICFTYCSSAIEALPMATFICCVKRLFDVFSAFIMPDMVGILFPVVFSMYTQFTSLSENGAIGREACPVSTTNGY